MYSEWQGEMVNGRERDDDGVGDVQRRGRRWCGLPDRKIESVPSVAVGWMVMEIEMSSLTFSVGTRWGPLTLASGLDWARGCWRDGGGNRCLSPLRVR